MSDHLTRFREFRERMNRRILDVGPLETKRFFALDTRAYEAGALDVPTKELLGLVSSLVLRCDDCVTYHLIRCKEEGLSDQQLREALHIGLVVGGSIVIPHLRRAMATLDDIAAERMPGNEEQP
jgi:AhpD family alkylhydroperoxidase